MLKVINLYGGAGCGKSTLAAQLFAKLKCQGKNVELVQEYQKELVYEEASSVYWNNQVLLFAQQYHKLNRLVDKVDYAITDNPLLTAIAYRQYTKTPASLDALVVDCYNQFDNYNYVLTRKPEYYSMLGRIHTLEESICIDTTIVGVLVAYQIPYHTIHNSADILLDLHECGISN